jgi:hypothetical protein
MKVEYVHLTKKTMSATLTRAQALRMIADIAKASAKSEHIRIIGWQSGNRSNNGKTWKTDQLSVHANP